MNREQSPFWVERAIKNGHIPVYTVRGPHDPYPPPRGRRKGPHRASSSSRWGHWWLVLILVLLGGNVLRHVALKILEMAR